MAASPRSRLLISSPFLVLLALLGCQDSTDLGKAPCHLVKKGADGGPVDVLVAELSPLKDFLSFGAVECEDLVCVLDKQGVSAVLAQAASNPAVLSNPALGYCSRACAQGSSSTCTPQFDNQQNQPGLAMSCQQLVLDQATIAEICKDAAKCLAYFDNNRSPFFCARGDGGV